MPLRRPSLALVIALLSAPYFAALSAEAPEPPKEQDAWAKIESSAECKNPESPKCEELHLKHFCQFQGSSYNANMCASGRRNKVEKELNRRYRQLLKGLTAVAKEERTWAKAPAKLVESERAWIIARAAECDFVSESFNEGTLQSAVMEDCMREEAERRLEAFKAHAKLFGIPW